MAWGMKCREEDLEYRRLEMEWRRHDLWCRWVDEQWHAMEEKAKQLEQASVPRVRACVSANCRAATTSQFQCSDKHTDASSRAVLSVRSSNGDGTYTLAAWRM